MEKRFVKRPAPINGGAIRRAFAGRVRIAHRDDEDILDVHRGAVHLSGFVACLDAERSFARHGQRQLAAFLLDLFLWQLGGDRPAAVVSVHGGHLNAHGFTIVDVRVHPCSRWTRIDQEKPLRVPGLRLLFHSCGDERMHRPLARQRVPCLRKSCEGSFFDQRKPVHDLSGQFTGVCRTRTEQEKRARFEPAEEQSLWRGHDDPSRPSSIRVNTNVRHGPRASQCGFDTAADSWQFSWTHHATVHASGSRRIAKRRTLQRRAYRFVASATTAAPAATMSASSMRPLLVWPMRAIAFLRPASVR